MNWREARITMELEEGNRSLLEENRKLSEELAQCKVCNTANCFCSKSAHIKNVTAVVCSSFMITDKLPVTLKRVIHCDPVTIFSPLRAKNSLGTRLVTSPDFSA